MRYPRFEKYVSEDSRIQVVHKEIKSESSCETHRYTEKAS